jgi:hypothetical protein
MRFFRFGKTSTVPSYFLPKYLPLFPPVLIPQSAEKAMIV